MKSDGEKRCLYCQSVMVRPRTKDGALLSPANWETRKYCSWICRAACPVYREAQRANAKAKGYGKWMTGKTASAETKEKISQSSKGHQRRPKGTWVPSEETKMRMSLSKRGEKSPLWRGGKTKQNALIRSGIDYRSWRKAVFSRDNHTCVFCGARGVEIHADHIKAFALYPELRFDLDNGRTLCVPCHKKTPSYLSGTKPPKRKGRNVTAEVQEVFREETRRRT